VSHSKEAGSVIGSAQAETDHAEDLNNNSRPHIISEVQAFFDVE
jgi:hypothetical protein